MALVKRRQKPASPFRRLQEQLKLADLVFELRDARAPESSGHPAADKLFSALPRIIVLSHLDLADAAQVKRWIRSVTLNSNAVNSKVIAVSLKLPGSKSELLKTVQEITTASSQIRLSRGILPAPARACVVGLPNVGKSTFINWLVGRRKAPAGNKPGITRGVQWIRVNSRFELLDTPGILPPVGFDQRTKNVLALLNLLAEGLYESEEIAIWVIKYLSFTYPNFLHKYGLDIESHTYLLEQIANLKNLRVKNNNPDCLRAATAFIQDVRKGVLGPLYFDVIMQPC